MIAEYRTRTLPGEEPKMGRERILLIDNSPQFRSVMGHQVLGGQGYEVLIAKSGSEGLALARDLQPDLIIAGYDLQEMNGLEIVAALKEAGLNIPIILTTAEGSEVLAVRAMRAGVRDYLIKPVTAEAMVDAVQRVLQQHWKNQIKERLPAHLLQANRKLERRLRELSTLVHLGKSVTSMRDLEQVLNQVVEAAVQVTGAEESSLLLVDKSTGQLYMSAAWNIDSKTVHTLRLKVEDSLAGTVVKTGEPIIVSGEDLIKIKTAYLVKCLVYVPLRSHNQVIGVLSVDNRTKPHEFDQHEVQVLSLLADFAAIAIENARLYAETIQERNTLDAILRDTEDHVIVVDADDKVLFCNPTARKTFFVTATDFIGKPLKDVIKNPEVLALFSKQALAGRGRHSEIRVNGGEQVLNAQLTIIEGVGRSAVMQDITYLKQMDREKSEFVTTVSHDLRSPLTAILAYIELIERVGSLNEQQAGYVKQITSSVESISTMTSELLELGRIEAGFDVDLEPVDLPQIANEIIGSLSHQVETKRHQLQIEFAEDLPKVSGNPLRLRQVVANLVGNAIKYTPDNGCVKISLQPDGALVVLQISDSGIGIPLDEQPFIFDKFYRTQRAIDEFEGTGLGLSIVKGIVEQHNGRIWLNSKENEGATFTVVLPVAK
jgi:PAS domain S-box-containing protein